MTNFDFGNLELIEGWATYFEWNTVDNGYSKLLKFRGAEYLKMSFSGYSLDTKIKNL